MFIIINDEKSICYHIVFFYFTIHSDPWYSGLAPHKRLFKRQWLLYILSHIVMLIFNLRAGWFGSETLMLYFLYISLWRTWFWITCKQEKVGSCSQLVTCRSSPGSSSSFFSPCDLNNLNFFSNFCLFKPQHPLSLYLIIFSWTAMQCLYL